MLALAYAFAKELTNEIHAVNRFATSARLAKTFCTVLRGLGKWNIYNVTRYRLSEHGVRFSGSGLPVGEDARVGSFVDEVRHQVADGAGVNGLLKSKNISL